MHISHILYLTRAEIENETLRFGQVASLDVEVFLTINS